MDDKNRNKTLGDRKRMRRFREKKREETKKVGVNKKTLKPIISAKPKPEKPRPIEPKLIKSKLIKPRLIKLKPKKTKLIKPETIIYTKEERLLIKVKLIFIAVFVAVSFIYLSKEIFRLKTAHGKEYENRAIVQLVQDSMANEQVINPNRGSIVDRNMTNLAVSKLLYDVFLDVRLLINRTDEVKIDNGQQISVQEDSFRKVSQVLGIPIETLYSYLEADHQETDDQGNVTKYPLPEYDSSHFFIAREVPYEKAIELESLKPRDVYLEAKSKRAYIYNDLAASVIGFIRGDKLFGLESQYDKYLSGTPGRIFRVYSNEGGVVTEKIDPKNGDTVITTLDIGIQDIADKAVTKWGEKYQAENTSCIVMNPKTGEILAMAEYPSFNLNNPVDLNGVTKPSYRDEWRNLNEKDFFDKFNRLWTNYNITDTYEPGSTFKPITVAAGLEENIITPDDSFYCPGGKEVGGVWINCHYHAGHGSQSLDNTLINSCNVAMMNIAANEGRDIFYKYQRDFGFGEKTGIDLPAEINAYKLVHPLDRLNSSELATSAFGQRFNATPIQIITSFAACINGGNLMRPHIVSRVVSEKGELVLENKPTVERKVISQETSDYLRETMEGVISRGTGIRAAIPGWAIGGKTGTGEQGIAGTEDYHYTNSIITYFPVDDPEYIIITIINRPEDGESASPSPFVKEVMEDIIRFKSLPPKREDRETNPDLDMVAVEDYTGGTLDNVTRELNNLSLDYEFIGNGTIVSGQYPEAGTMVPKNSMIILYIEYDGEEHDMTTIPNLVGMEQSEAVETLNSLNLEPVIEIIDDREIITVPPPRNTDAGEQPSDEDGNSLDAEAEAESEADSEADSEDNSVYKVYQQIPPQDGTNVIIGTQIKIKVKK